MQTSNTSDQRWSLVTGDPGICSG